MIVSQAMSYYFYNAKTKQVLSTPSLKVPEGFRIMQPPKTLKLNRGNYFLNKLHTLISYFLKTIIYNILQLCSYICQIFLSSKDSLVLNQLILYS